MEIPKYLNNLLHFPHQLKQTRVNQPEWNQAFKCNSLPDTTESKGDLFGMLKWTPFILISAVLILAACQEAPVKPIDVREQDTCARCKMLIADVKFAAEVIDKAGTARKFDDIGCMIDYFKTKQPMKNFRAQYVVDYDTKQWLKLEEAFFVHAKAIKTPMGGSTVAFHDKQRATSVAQQMQGGVISFDDLMKLEPGM
jgi:copper chaperone NosL